MTPLPLTLIFHLTEYWQQLTPGTRDNIIGGLTVALVVAAVGLLWKFGARLMTRFGQITAPRPEPVPAASSQEVKVAPTAPTLPSEPVQQPRSSTSFVIPRRPAVGFVARRDGEGRNIVERLRDELAPEKNQLVVLHGPGGVGKTTLAAEAARALEEVFDGRIAWISADGRSAFALSTLLDESARQMGREDLRQLPPEEKAGAVAALLGAEKPLLVLDNFETIADDEQVRCVDFLSQRASCPALITTRRKIGSTRNITIPAMESAEAEELLKLLITETTSHPSAFAEVDLERVKQVSERNPLVMQWVIAQIDLAQEADTVLDDLRRGAGDAVQRVFDRSFELKHLGDDGRAALLALSLFVPDASRVALAEVSGFAEDLTRLNQAVNRLASLSLVKTTDGGSRLTIEGLTRELAEVRLSKSENAGEFHRRFVVYFLGYAQAHRKPTPEDFDVLETEKDNAFNSMELAFDLSDWQSVMRLMDALSFDGVNGFLPMRGHWEEAVRQGNRALEAARSVSNKAQIARFAHILALNYQSRGDLADARQLYHESLEISKKLGNQIGIAAALGQLATLAKDQGELGKARQLYNESLEISKKLGDQSGIAISLHQLAVLAQLQVDVKEARQLYNESLEIKKKLDDQSGIADTLHNLAVLAQDQGDLEEAQHLYNESLEIKKKLGDQSGIAITLHQLATLAQDQDDLEEARQLYNQSLEICKKLGNQSGIASTLHNLGDLAYEQGKTNEAAQMYREALAILERLGSPDADIARQNLARLEKHLS